MANDGANKLPSCLQLFLELGEQEKWAKVRDAPGELLAEKFKAYEEGKHRRYGLLFAVNGGAFAIAKLFIETNKKTGGDVNIVLGNLRLWHLSLGMILFTGLMTWDICVFGRRMNHYDRANFGLVGRAVLLSICCLIMLGWLFAGWSDFRFRIGFQQP